MENFAELEDDYELTAEDTVIMLDAVVDAMIEAKGTNFAAEHLFRQQELLAKRQLTHSGQTNIQ